MCTLSGDRVMRGPPCGSGTAALALAGTLAAALPGAGAAAPTRAGGCCCPHAVSAARHRPSAAVRPSIIRRGRLLPQDLAGVHGAVRIEGALHGPHELELHRGSIGVELGELEPADAVLGAEAAAELAHQVVHRAPHAVGAREKTLAVGAGELAH